MEAGTAAEKPRGTGLSTKGKVLLGLGAYLATVVAFVLIFPSGGKNDEFQPQNEFKLDAWIPIKIGSLDLSINKAVLYLVLASILTVVTLTYIAKRMQQRPNRVQTAVEAAYVLMRDQITGANMDRRMAAKW